MPSNNSGGFMDKNAMIRQRLVSGITEDEFIEDFEEIMSFKGFMMLVPKDDDWRPNPHVRNQPMRLQRMWMPSCLNKIHSMNPSRNAWADEVSDRLRAFLKLRGEEI